MSTQVSTRNESTRATLDPAMRDEIPACWGDEARSIRGAVHFGETVRPWNWLELDAVEAEKLWSLLINFVTWFNHRYGDRSDQRIPPCWAEHGPLVEELTTLMFARWHAFGSVHSSVGGAQYWHSYTLPGFFGRMHDWLRDDLLTCQQGLHRDHPEPPPSYGDSWSDRTLLLAQLDVLNRREESSSAAEGAEKPFTSIEVPFLDEAKDQPSARKAIP